MVLSIELLMTIAFAFRGKYKNEVTNHKVGSREFRDMVFEDVGVEIIVYFDPQQLKVWGLHTQS